MPGLLRFCKATAGADACIANSGASVNPFLPQAASFAALTLRAALRALLRYAPFLQR